MNSLVLALLIKSSLLIGAAFLVNRLLLRHRSAASRHLVWTFALGGVLLLPMISAAVPGLAIPIRVGAVASESVDAPSVVMDEPEATIASGAVTLSAPITQSLSAQTASAETSWGSVALAIYAAGLLLLGVTNGLNLLVPWLVKVAVDALAREHGVARPAPVVRGLEEPTEVLGALVLVGILLTAARTGSRWRPSRWRGCALSLSSPRRSPASARSSSSRRSSKPRRCS